MDTIFAHSYPNLTMGYNEIKVYCISIKVMLQPGNIFKIPGSDFRRLLNITEG